MDRKIDAILSQWKDQPHRLPLLVDGARQVGKTHALIEFGKNAFANLVVVNFEENPGLGSLFDGDIDPKTIVEILEAFFFQRILPGSTLLFFDEIQACGRALTALKYFQESAPEYCLVAAGSLLGVALHHPKSPFPVGKVDRIQMFPMDFEEFLWAMGRKELADRIRRHFQTAEPMPSLLHEEALSLYRRYLVTGGMPAAVAEYAKNGSLLPPQAVQHRVLGDYSTDMGKYASPAETVRIRSCFDSIPVQLARENAKFQYKTVRKGGSASYFGSSIEWLEQAGIVLKCNRVGQGLIPLEARRDLSSFKLYMGDVGLLSAKSGIPSSLLLSPLGEENDFLGHLVENYVAQTLRMSGHPLYYWTSEGIAEVDFLLQKRQSVIPVEVKKGRNTRSRSLNLFLETYSCPEGIRISAKNFGWDGRIRSVPLYAVHCI